MSGLIFQNNSTKCKNWDNTSKLITEPNIISLSGYYSPAGSTTLLSISGTNFFSYSTISFATFKPTVFFINSNILQFYIPSTLKSGTYTIQVFNGYIGSNIVTYNIDNASGYWLLNNNGNISNTNSTGLQASTVSITSLSRGPPIITDASSNINPYIVPYNITWIICNTNNHTVFIQLPSVTECIGREIIIKNPSGTHPVLSNDSNIISINYLDEDENNTNIILPAIQGAWATIVYKGNYWVTMQSNFTS